MSLEVVQAQLMGLEVLPVRRFNWFNFNTILIMATLGTALLSLFAFYSASETAQTIEYAPQQPILTENCNVQRVEKLTYTLQEPVTAVVYKLEDSDSKSTKIDIVETVELSTKETENPPVLLASSDDIGILIEESSEADEPVIETPQQTWTAVRDTCNMRIESDMSQEEVNQILRDARSKGLDVSVCNLRRNLAGNMKKLDLRLSDSADGCQCVYAKRLDYLEFEWVYDGHIASELAFIAKEGNRIIAVSKFDGCRARSIYVSR